MKIGFKITLDNVDSGGSFTKFERLQRAMKRSSPRLKRFSEMVLTTKNPNLTSTVYPNRDGEFLMNLSIGTPPVSYSAIMDTGRALIWTQGKPCLRCFSQPTPVFDPKKSSSYSNVSCSNKLCKALPISSCKDGSDYRYAYEGGAFTSGFLATETFSFDNI
ncbi:hypothetical protein RHMOL_Rhmol03G0246300 [Rhododendron molle]|uniref:Uncharacterized protein n=1 Tax=Rhododendron molle TaxID=49168 RepID=A0ACC0PJD5_RHOML|nr:hypothetical protein RHMOL_Rhmol03G0246300 [Rhododendron molle]